MSFTIPMKNCVQINCVQSLKRSSMKHQKDPLSRMAPCLASFFFQARLKRYLNSLELACHDRSEEKTRCEDNTGCDVAGERRWWRASGSISESPISPSKWSFSLICFLFPLQSHWRNVNSWPSGITVALSQRGAALISAQVTDTGEPYQQWQFFSGKKIFYE